MIEQHSNGHIPPRSQVPSRRRTNPGPSGIGTAAEGPLGVTAERRAVAVDELVSGLRLGPGDPVDDVLLNEVIASFFALGGGDRATSRRSGRLRARLDAALARKGSLGSFTERVKNDLVRRHAPLTTFLALADLRPIIDHPLAAGLARKIAHQAFVLDALVELMIEDPRYSVELRRHFYEQRAATGFGFRRLQASFGTFAAIKVATIDVGFRPIFGIPLGVERTRSQARLSWFGYTSWSAAVCLNIAEAMVTEAFDSYDNACAALQLIAAWPRSGALGREHREVLLRYPAGWAALYKSWNLLFVFSHVLDPHLIIAKLLIPSVTSADDDNYLYRRLLALWITIQSRLLVKDTGREPEGLDLDPEYKTGLKRLWGSVNRTFSKRFAQRSRGGHEDGSRSAFESMPRGESHE